jgi:hypothetical protein
MVEWLRCYVFTGVRSLSPASWRAGERGRLLRSEGKSLVLAFGAVPLGADGRSEGKEAGEAGKTAH